jgi:hypothetical protein
MQIEHILITPDFMTIRDIGQSGNEIMTGIKFTQKRLKGVLDSQPQKTMKLGVYKTVLESVKKAISKTKYTIKSESANQWSNGYFNLVLEYNNGV